MAFISNNFVRKDKKNKYSVKEHNMCFYQEEDVLSGIMAEIVPLPCNSAADYFRLRIFTMISWVRKSLSGYSRTYYLFHNAHCR